MEILAIKLHIGTKKKQGDVNKLFKVHIELSFLDSTLIHKGRKESSDEVYWKDG